MRKRTAFALIFAAAFWLVLMVVLVKRAPETAEATRRRDLTRLRSFLACDFHPISIDSAELSNLVSRIPLRVESHLPFDAEASGRGTIVNFLRAFSAGSY